MSFTIKEAELISRLRSDLGDNPTTEAGLADTTLQIWTDSEHLTHLNGALNLAFKGKRSDLEHLSTFEEELVILEATIKLNYILAQDSSRYVKYKIKDVNVEKLSPSEFLKIASALEKKKKLLLDEDSDLTDVGYTVKVYSTRRYDKRHSTLSPQRYQPPATLPKWYLEIISEGVKITLKYSFIADYSLHFIKKMDDANNENDSAGSILQTWYKLAENVLIDTNVVDGGVYRYRLYVESINGVYTYEDKSITYAIQ